MIPEFLSNYSDQLEEFKLASIRIKAIPVENEETLNFKQSKFLGKPYLPLNFEYPKDVDGKPLILLAQINFDEFPKLEDYPTSGILQFYISSSNWYDMSDYKIIFHEDISGNHQTDFAFLTTDFYEESPVYCEHKLEFEKNIEYGGATDFRFIMYFDGKGFYEFCEDLNQNQKQEIEKIIDGTGHKIGGYAYFTQSDPRDYDQKLQEDILLLQIDTDEQILFGDCGVANLFIHPDELKAKNFEKAWFNWDCC